MLEPVPFAYSHLLQEIANQPQSFQHKDLVAFYPMRGPGKSVNTMFIGRALNGWHWNFKVETLKEDSSKVLQDIITKQHPESAPDNPLTWVDNHHSNGKEYNSARSQFWKVLREVSRARNPEVHWSEGVVWSNFFKIAPWGRNPTGRMIKVMGLASHQLLLAEINYFKPKNIVCLAGFSWAEYLLNSATVKHSLPFQGELVEYVGDLSWEDGKIIRFVIAPHPQTRPAVQLINEINLALDAK